jgi:hypothetical protein
MVNTHPLAGRKTEVRMMLSVDDRRPLFGRRRSLLHEAALDDMDFNVRTGSWLRGSLALRGKEVETVSARLGRNPSAPSPLAWLDKAQ